MKMEYHSSSYSTYQIDEIYIIDKNISQITNIIIGLSLNFNQAYLNNLKDTYTSANNIFVRIYLKYTHAPAFIRIVSYTIRNHPIVTHAKHHFWNSVQSKKSQSKKSHWEKFTHHDLPISQKAIRQFPTQANLTTSRTPPLPPRENFALSHDITNIKSMKMKISSITFVRNIYLPYKWNKFHTYTHV